MRTNNNKNILVNNIPAHITNDAENAEFVLFLNMMGQHFDTLWSYTKGIAKSKKLDSLNSFLFSFNLSKVIDILKSGAILFINLVFRHN